MKYKLFLYDCFEKSQFEEELNQLSKQGFNALEIGWMSKFEKKDTSYFYKVDILKGNKLKQTKKINGLLRSLFIFLLWKKRKTYIF